MADNRMYLVHGASGQRILIAKDFTGTWSLFRSERLAEHLAEAFRIEGEYTSAGLASTEWRLEYEKP